MKNPVLLDSDKHTYEREAIEKWFFSEVFISQLPAFDLIFTKAA